MLFSGAKQPQHQYCHCTVHVWHSRRKHRPAWNASACPLSTESPFHCLWASASLSLSSTFCQHSGQVRLQRLFKDLNVFLPTSLSPTIAATFIWIRPALYSLRLAVNKLVSTSLVIFCCPNSGKTLCVSYHIREWLDNLSMVVLHEVILTTWIWSDGLRPICLKHYDWNRWNWSCGEVDFFICVSLFWVCEGSKINSSLCTQFLFF